MIAIDVSTSMLAQDMKPSRLEFAKTKIIQLLDLVNNDGIGLIVFAGSSYIQSPLTTDYSSIKTFLLSIDSTTVSHSGTEISRAIQLAIDHFSEQTVDSRLTIEQRKKILKTSDMDEIINSFTEDLLRVFSNEREVYVRDNKQDAFITKIKPVVGKTFKDSDFKGISNLKNKEFENMMKERFSELRNKRSEKITEKINLELEKRIFLQTVDFLWRSHLQYLEHLRQVVGLRGYAQKDPLQEFKREAFRLFENLLNKIKTDFITFLNNLEIETESQNKIEKIDKPKKEFQNNPKCLLVIKKDEKISRNEKCPATGKKYKHCCGFL